MPEATSSGEPDAGNPHVRFDEGRGTGLVPSYSTGSEGRQRLGVPEVHWHSTRSGRRLGHRDRFS
jgi:hypothetical protein